MSPRHCSAPERELARPVGRLGELALRGLRVGEHPPGAREERVPGGERHRPRRPVERRVPSSRSRLRTEDGNPDWLTCASTAARVKFSSCATTTKNSICLRSILPV